MQWVSEVWERFMITIWENIKMRKKDSSSES